jgi:hypothetical protein
VKKTKNVNFISFTQSMYSKYNARIYNGLSQSPMRVQVYHVTAKMAIGSSIKLENSDKQLYP